MNSPVRSGTAKEAVTEGRAMEWMEVTLFPTTCQQPPGTVSIHPFIFPYGLAFMLTL
jgi:hypothetical protein